MGVALFIRTSGGYLGSPHHTLSAHHDASGFKYFYLLTLQVLIARCQGLQIEVSAVCFAVFIKAVAGAIVQNILQGVHLQFFSLAQDLHHIGIDLLIEGAALLSLHGALAGGYQQGECYQKRYIVFMHLAFSSYIKGYRLQQLCAVA